MVFSFSGGLDKPGIDGAGVPVVVDPANFDFRKIRFERISETMKPDVGGIGEAYSSGFRVKAEDLPKVVQIADAAHLVDLDSDGALKYASPALRDLIERLEPGVHQFEPCVFVDGAGHKIADMFVFFVCQRLDTVDRIKTTGMYLSPHIWTSAKTLARIKPNLLPEGVDLDIAEKMVFSVQQVGSASLWVDKHIPATSFASANFIDAFYAEGLKGLAKSEMESVG